MADTQKYDELEASIDIDAPPAQVWALVTDLPRMSAWSPQVAVSRVRGGTVQLGATFDNLNRQGLLVWPTSGKVVRFEPHRDFAFRVRENRTVWSFELADNGRGGTTVTQRRELPHGISRLSITLTKAALGGVGPFTRRLERGMEETLTRVKAESEAAAQRVSKTAS